MTDDTLPPVCLTIAGSDSGGGAGIEADLKAFLFAGVHGTCAITSITAQNTVGVTAIEPVSPAMIVAQVAAVSEDFDVAAVKIGMLGSRITAEAVAESLSLMSEDIPVVVDPVMVAESGARLLDDDALDALKTLILPRAAVVTPNLAEARVLADAGAGAGDDDEVEGLARAINGLGPEAVIVTGGHRDEVVDTLLDGDRIVRIAGERHPDGAAHGSGCTHSSLVAASLAHGNPLELAAGYARQVAGDAVLNGLRGIGHGAGPVDVFGLKRSGSPGGRDRIET